MIKGKLNSFMSQKLARVKGSSGYDKFEDVSLKLSEVGVDDEDSYKVASTIYYILQAAYGNVDSSILKKSYLKANELGPENINDFYYIVLSTVVENLKINKVAYPIMMGALSDDPPPEFNMKRWSEFVHKIYDAVLNSGVSFEKALDYYSGFLDKSSGEDIKFKKWLSYYKNGEHLKYSKEEKGMKVKTGLYQFSPHGIDFYPSGSDSIISPVEDIKETTKSVKRNESYREWKTKLNAAIRRIDKLLRVSEDSDIIDTDKYEELRNLLHRFDIEVGKTRLQSTASDLTYKLAMKLDKLGMGEQSEELVKIAQEAPPADQPIPIEGEEPVASPPEQQLEEAGVPVEGEAPEQESVSEKLEKTKPVSPRDIVPLGGPAVGEYESLVGDISISDATSKLEEVAGLLADRRPIRMLAEFDIMLDRLGVASMFSELPEAQSRLIEAYSYAMTRTTKMLGMLSSGRSLLDAAVNHPSDTVPGAQPESPEESPEEVVDKTPIEEEFAPSPGEVEAPTEEPPLTE